MRWLSVLVFGVATLAVAGEAQACSCVKQSLEDGVAQSQAIFEGTVTEIATNTTTEFRGLEITFSVKRAWKGIESQEVAVVTASKGAACGYPFAEGSTYLVYAYRSKTDPLRVSLCSLTKPIEDARADLKYLGKPQKKFANSRKKNRCSVSPASDAGPDLSAMALLVAGLVVTIRRRP